MIKAIQFENYKSFKGVQNLVFDAERNVYLVYGKNSSGKTNLYKLFKDISSIVNNYNFFDDLSFIQSNNIFCKEDGNTTFKLSIVFEVGMVEYGYTIHIDYLTGPIYETLQTEDKVIYNLVNGKIECEIYIL